MPTSTVRQATDLTDFIEKDLAARLVSGNGAPVKLTLDGIAGHYGVSRTPARLAVGNLIREGILEKQLNGQLVPRAGVGGAAGAVPVRPPPSTKDRDRLLLKEIMLASLEAESVYLREEAMAQKLGIGRAVVRQTLGRLASPGLLEHVPRRGWLVPPIDHERVRAYLQVRETLELRALDLALPSLRDDVLKDLLDSNHDIHSRRFKLDNALHEYWTEQSGNFYIQAFFKQPVARYHTLLFHHATPEVAVTSDMAAQHCAILEALLAREPGQAKRCLSKHIWTQERILRDLVARRNPRMTMREAP